MPILRPASADEHDDFRQERETLLDCLRRVEIERDRLRNELARVRLEHAARAEQPGATLTSLTRRQ